jgi:hypothetical protein
MMRVNQIRILILSLVIVALSFTTGCNSQLSLTQNEEQDTETPVPEGRSTWDLLGDLNKVEKLDIDIVPHPDVSGTLPRRTGEYYLGMELPKKGYAVREMKILLMQEQGGNRRIRLFARDGKVYKIWTFIKTKSAVADNDPETLFGIVRSTYGEPDAEIMNQMVYVDNQTVAVFRSGGRYFMVELQDIDRGEFSEDILLLIDEKMQHEIERRRKGKKKSHITKQR